MAYCLQFFHDQGLVPEIPAATLTGLWRTELVEEVLGEIGRVPESQGGSRDTPPPPLGAPCNVSASHSL